MMTREDIKKFITKIPDLKHAYVRNREDEYWLVEIVDSDGNEMVIMDKALWKNCVEIAKLYKKTKSRS